jgi:hypothetical protein
MISNIPQATQLPHYYLPCTCYGPEHCYYCGQPEYHLNHEDRPSLPLRIFESIRITEENTWIWCAAIVGLVATLTLLGVFLW